MKTDMPPADHRSTGGDAAGVGVSSSANADRAPAAAGSADANRDVANTSAPRHLVVLLHGIWGFDHQWARFAARLAAHPAAGALLVHAAAANASTATADGVDACGRRAAAEVRRVVNSHPSLEEISIIGHSMGGLVARYMVGLLDPAPRAELAAVAASCGGAGGAPAGAAAAAAAPAAAAPGTLLGGRLRARALVTIATPHLGCAPAPGELAGGDGGGGSGSGEAAAAAAAGWGAPWMIRALAALHAWGWVSFDHHQHHDHHGHGEQRQAQQEQQQQGEGGSAGSAAAAAAAAATAGKLAAAAGAADAAAEAAAAPAAPASRTHPLLLGPRAAIGNRSVGQLMGLDRHACLAGPSAAGAAAEEAVAAAEEAAGGAAPLLDAMTYDWPAGPRFMSGLAAFEVRAVFSTAGGDHLIPWASSSLRAPEALPARAAGGALAGAWAARGAAVVEDARPRGGGDDGGGSNGGDGGCASAAVGLLGMRGRLRRLRRLPWRRFDVAWPRWAPGPLHNAIFMHGPGGPLGAAVADAVAGVVLLPASSSASCSQ